MHITEGSQLWQYLSPQQRNLVEDGEFLLHDSELHVDREPTDFSYLVFPFAKMYEGFLKQLFADLDLITSNQYYSDRFRIGKALSPNFSSRYHGYSVFREFDRRFGIGLATRLWHTWKEARNLVFHYFPHNYRSLTRPEAIELIDELLIAMDETVRITKVQPKKRADYCIIGKGDVQRALQDVTH